MVNERVESMMRIFCMRKLSVNRFSVSRTIAFWCRSSVAALLVLFSLISITACEQGPPPDINVGWMTSWSTGAGIIQALERTNIPELYGVPLAFKSFLFGPEVNEAAMAGQLDVVNTGLVPTISLLANDSDWIVVARFVESPLSIVARKESGINKIGDLRARTIGVPFGGGAHPYVIRKLKELNMTSNGNMQTGAVLSNVKPSEQELMLEQAKVQAVGTWEPQTSQILSKRLGLLIDEERHIGLITVRKKVATERPDDIVKLLEAYYQAIFYAAQHKAQVDGWYAAVTGIDGAVMPNVQVIDSNMKAKNIGDVTLDLTGQDLLLAQSYADTMFEEKMIWKKIDFSSRCDFSFLKKAKEKLQSEPSKTKDVKPEAPRASGAAKPQ